MGEMVTMVGRQAVEVGRVRLEEGPLSVQCM